MRERISLDHDGFLELVVWKLPSRWLEARMISNTGLHWSSEDVCVMRYDNEAGKGDHKHLGEIETDYPFRELAQMQRDFWDDVDRWRQG